MSIKKGHIIDEHCSVKGELVEYNGLVYSCTLNQTEIDANKNKFYIMQLIKNGGSYTFFVRFGRLGEHGKPLTSTFSDEASGKSAFEKQFKAKTGNAWGTKSFVKKPNKYFLSDVSYDELNNIDLPKEIKVPDSKLPERTQELIKLLSNENLMTNALISLDIDIKKMPLGKIKASQLELANGVLNSIEKLISKPDDAELSTLSNQFYLYLPMSFGRRKPSIINNNEILQKYRDTIDELKNIAVTVKIQEGIKAGDNPIDKTYEGINTKITPLEKNSKMWNTIENYLKTTHGPTHSNCKLELMDIFEVEQHGKKEIFDNYTKNIDNKTLLIHGSCLQNFMSIMKNHFYLDPSKVDSKIPIAGKMFGMGVI